MTSTAWTTISSGAARLPLPAAVVAAVVVVAVTLSPGSATPGGDERPAREPARWTTTVDRSRGFEVGLPAGWRLAPESLTPHLSDPRERLSAATFALRFREGRCNHMPSGALRSMGPADGFVTILERGRGSGRRGFPARPSRFAERAEPRPGDVSGCFDGRRGLVEFWMPFSDAGRHFYALVVLGSRAPAGVRSEAFAVLDRLRFDREVRPGWKASP